MMYQDGTHSRSILLTVGAASSSSMGQVDRLWRGSVFDGVSFRLFFIGTLEVFWSSSYRS
jgi:hypothetical protein